MANGGGGVAHLKNCKMFRLKMVSALERKKTLHSEEDQNQCPRDFAIFANKKPYISVQNL